MTNDFDVTIELFWGLSEIASTINKTCRFGEVIGKSYFTCKKEIADSITRILIDKLGYTATIVVQNTVFGVVY